MAITNARRLTILKELKSSGLPDELFKSFEQALDDSSPAAEKLTTQFLAQSDYSREMNKIAEAEKARQQEHLNFKTEIATTRDNLNRWAQQTAQELMAKEAKLIGSAKRQVERLSNAKKLAQSDTGLPLGELEPDPVLVEFASLPVTAVEPGKFSPSPAPTPQPAQQQFNQPNQQFNQPTQGQQMDTTEAAAFLAKQMAALVDLPVRHRALFGNDLDVTSLVDESLRQGRDPRELWEENYNVAAVKEEAVKKQWLQEARTQWEAEMAQKMNLSPGSTSFGDFSKLANSVENLATKFSGEGNDALGLDPSFRARMQREGKTFTPPAQGTNPNQPNPIAQTLSDEAIGQELFANLAAREG